MTDGMPAMNNNTEKTSTDQMTQPLPGTTEERLDTIVQTKDPAFAFAELRQLMKQSGAITNNCHMLTHAIGNSAFKKYGSFKDAMRFNDDLCGSGYIHSLIVNVFDSAKDPTETIGTICAGMDGFCYHGIGHGVMFYTKNDVPRSLEYCATLDTNEHQARCSEGVFMQNFESKDKQMYLTPYAYADEPLKLCRETVHFKPACYLYAGEFLAKKWLPDENIFAFCNTSEKGYIGQCVSGMGAYSLAINIASPEKAEAVCNSTTNQTTRKSCIDGLVSYHLVNYNSVPKTEEYCNSMAAENQPFCEASLLARKKYYQ